MRACLPVAHGGHVRVSEQQQQERQRQQRRRFDIAGVDAPVLVSGNGVLTRRPLSSRPMTQTRPIRSALNELQNADVGTSVKYQVCSVHTWLVYTTGTTGTGHIGMSGTATTQVPATSVSSAWHHYRYRTIRYVRYDIHTDTVHFGKFHTIWIPVPDT